MKVNTEGYVAQLAAGSPGEWPAVFAALSSLTDSVRINNIDSRRSDLLDYLAEIGIKQSISQYELEMAIPAV